MRHVHVVISDKGWILERLASELQSRLPYLTYGLRPDPAAALQYYVTYGARTTRVSEKEAALFTHLEAEPNARAKFFDVAQSVDCAIAMSKAAADPLIAHGLKGVEIISPGVDLDRFRPKLRIGVVGRTYHTGRKGESLLSQLGTIEDVEFVYTGDGWPGPAQQIPEADLPEFYRSLDYVLVPATNEGGPMCVLEALSSGVPVIASNVGWVTDFPHIPFENGNVGSLRAVLEQLRGEKLALRQSVEKRTWDAWAAEHDALFGRMLGIKQKRPLKRKQPARVSTTPEPVSARLLMHGQEAISRGGPSVRVPRTAHELRLHGIDAQAGTFPSPNAFDADLIHLFNVWPASSAVLAARLAQKAGKPLVFSPILLDLGELDFWQRLVMRRVEGGVDDSIIDDLLRDYRTGTGWSRALTPEPAFNSRLRELAHLSDALIFLSERERSLFHQLSGASANGTIIRNPVDANAFDHADPQLFKEQYGLSEFILCVARIEPRKNQLMLMRAAKELGLPLVLVGHAGSQWYERAARAYASDQVHFIGRLEHGSDLLRSAIAGCRVFALPSWAEGAPLAALEAAAAGANLVLSNRSGEREYFGELAQYADPADIDSLKTALADAWNDADRTERSSALKEKVRTEYSWARYAGKTAELYRSVRSERGREIDNSCIDLPSNASIEAERSSNLVIDVTTSLNAGRLKSGINRVEAELSRALLEHDRVDTRFVVWVHGLKRFVEVPKAVVLADGLKAYIDLCGASVPALEGMENGGSLLVVGSGWMQNSEYAETLSLFAAEHALSLNVVVHDLTPIYWTHWFKKGYSPIFAANLKILLRTADRLLTYSDNTSRDVRRYAAESAIACPEIGRFKLASEVATASQQGAADPTPYAGQRFATSRFVLAVGAIHRRKNYELLYDCWLELREKLGAQCPHLVVVGGISWNGDDIARALTEDQRLSGYVHILTDVDDQKLDWLYKNCTVTAYPSLYEGWGLPVAESLAYGKVCIASNTSSVPEIAPELTDLIDPTDRKAWAARILHYVTSASARGAREEKIRRSYVPVSWPDSASSIVSALETPAAEPSDRFLCNLGAVTTLSTTSERGKNKLRGWYPQEGSGSWSSANEAVLRFDLRPAPTDDLLVAAKLTVLGRSGESAQVRVQANGTDVSVWQVPADGRPLRYAKIPRERIGPDGRLDLAFQTKLESVQRVRTGSNDLRKVGVNLSEVQIVECSTTASMIVAGNLGRSDHQRAGPVAIDAGSQLVGTKPGVRLLLPGLAILGDCTLVVAAEPLQAEVPENVEAIVLLNGRQIGTMSSTSTREGLEFFPVDGSIAGLQDPATVEILRSGPPPAQPENALQISAIMGLKQAGSVQMLESKDASVQFTKRSNQLPVAGALMHGGGASPFGIRMGARSEIEVSLAAQDATVAIVRFDEAPLSDRPKIAVWTGVDWTLPVACTGKLTIMPLPEAETQVRLKLINDQEVGMQARLRSVELTRLLPLEADAVELAELDSQYLMAEDFHVPQPDGRWSKGAHCSLHFLSPLVPTEALHIELDPHLVSNEDSRRVQVLLNGEAIADLELTNPYPTTYAIPAAIPPGSVCRIDLLSNSSFVPDQLWGNGDNREIGVFVRTLRCIPADETAAMDQAA